MIESQFKLFCEKKGSEKRSHSGLIKEFLQENEGRFSLKDVLSLFPAGWKDESYHEGDIDGKEYYQILVNQFLKVLDVKELEDDIYVTLLNSISIEENKILVIDKWLALNRENLTFEKIKSIAEMDFSLEVKGVLFQKWFETLREMSLEEFKKDMDQLSWKSRDVFIERFAEKFVDDFFVEESVEEFLKLLSFQSREIWFTKKGTSTTPCQIPI